MSDELERALAEARYCEDKLRLYRAKVYGPRPTSPERLRELERAHDLAQQTLALVRARHAAD